MTSKGAAITAAALLAGISGVLAPSNARAEAGHQIPPGLARVMADGAGRAAGVPEGQSACGWARDFVRRHGRERAVEIARLQHSDAEIEAWRRACFPDQSPVARR